MYEDWFMICLSVGVVCRASGEGWGSALSQSIVVVSSSIL